MNRDRNTPEFTDRFASQAEQYATFRPSYPPEMIAWLAGLAPGHGLAWDCATGSGQAARLLALHFARVVATDASARQLAMAPAIANVEYRQARAEDSEMAEASADLIMVAQALHWFDVGAFYREVQRVLKPHGVLAISVYDTPRTSPEVDAIMDRFYHDRVGRYWASERRHVDAHYSTLPFPFAEIPTPRFTIDARLDRAALVGYVSSWSAVARCREVEGQDPIAGLDADLAAVWPEASERRRVVWPLTLRVGRKE